jgi:hypothetical protein
MIAGHGEPPGRRVHFGPHADPGPSGDDAGGFGLRPGPAPAEAVGVQVLTMSEIQAMAAEAVERIEREFAELNRTGRFDPPAFVSPVAFLVSLRPTGYHFRKVGERNMRRAGPRSSQSITRR